MEIQLSDHFNDKRLLRFTLPTIFVMIFTSIYGIVDGLFISNCVGSDAFAAVNLVMPVIMIPATIGFMIGTGGSALISKTLGEGKEELAKEYFTMLIYVMVVVGIFLTVVGEFSWTSIVSLLGADANMWSSCITYGRIALITLPCYILECSFQSFLIVAEKPNLGLGIMLSAGITNMVLDFLFVYVFGFGVFGAAVATGIGEIVGGIAPFFYFCSKQSTILRLKKTRLHLKALGRSLANGSSEMMTDLSTSVINILYNYQLMRYVGADGVTSYGIIMYISFIFVGTFFGYSTGVGPIIGYHYGAQNTDELKNLFKESVKIILIFELAMIGAAELLSRGMATIFVGYDAELLDMATHAIRIYSLSFLFNGLNIFASSLFTALNNGLISASMAFLRIFVFQVIMIFLLPTLFGLNGIWSAIIASEFMGLLVGLFFVISQRKNYHYL